MACLLVFLFALPLASPARADGTGLEAQATRFWQTVSAKPADRPALLALHFSAGVRERNGDADLLETFAMLAEALGPELASLSPSAVIKGAEGDELHYTLANGQRVSLMLVLSADDPPKIERFGVRPLPPEVAAVAPAALPAAIASHLEAEFKAGRFTGTVLVGRGDDTLYAGAFGLADRRSGRPNTLDTPFNLGSINKMFTGIAIAQLQAAGKLDWTDTVGRHLPDFPNAQIRDRVTLHQLLTHTSGVGSYWNQAHTDRRHELDSQQEFLETFVDQPLLFEPGQGMEYSNGGPVILGLVIEAISGKNYYDYVRDAIYRPAGMTHADHYRRDDAAAGFALGYLMGEDGAWRDNTDELSARGSAAGGGYASARDLQAFARAMADGRLLSQAQWEVLWKAHAPQGRGMDYGYLFSSGTVAGQRWVGHNGGAPGISAEFRYYPADDLVIVVLANQDNASMAVGEWLNALVLTSLAGTPPPPSKD
ncbi:serine hydrolase domain-containing protein [Arenimonas sp. MALMAid1274]